MQDPLLGQQLGSYRLGQVLGQGSFAQVYRGQHVHLGVSAAVKILHAQFGEQEKQNFRAEAVLLTRLKHEHIIRFLDYGFVNGRPYLITDLAEKGSLQRMYPRGTRLSLQQIVEYVEQIADGLTFAHAQHIVHRDIKPENILVSDTGALLLADFGIAKMLGTSGSSYLTSSMAGTLPYMAPELFEGRPSPFSDQYALGVMVYEWLTGRFPFDGSAGELIKHHLQDPPPPLRSFQPSISPEVELVVLMALRKEPEQRFRTVQAFANALRQASMARPQARGGQQPSRPLPPPRQPGSGDSRVGVDGQAAPQPQKPSNPPRSRVASPTPLPPVPSDPNRPPQRAPLSPGQPRVASAVPAPSPGQPLPGGPGASSGPSLRNRPPLPSDPQIAPGTSRAPVSSNSGSKAAQPVATDPSRSLQTTDPDDWQKLLPPQQSLPFTQLPGLPQALLTDFWWPTFVVTPEQRRKINQGTISSEMLSALGPLTSFPSLSVALPVSSATKPLSIGRLDSAQRISTAVPVSPAPASRPQPVSALAPIGSGRVAPAAQAPNQSSAQAQAGMPKPAARTAQAVKAGAKQSNVSSASGSSSAVGAMVTASLTVIIGLFCTIGAGSSHTRSAIAGVVISWICLGIAIVASSIGINQAKQSTALKGWLIFFLIVAILLAIINIPVCSLLNSYCC